MDPGRQRGIVRAFAAAAGEGDFEALLAVLDPDVLVRVAWGEPQRKADRDPRIRRRRSASCGVARAFGGLARPALVNGAAGVLVAAADGRPVAVMTFIVRRDTIVEIDILRDDARLEVIQWSRHDPAKQTN